MFTVIPSLLAAQLWKVDSASEGQEFLLDLADHGSAVNIARFSPCGKMLASASDRQIVIYVGKVFCRGYFLTHDV